MESLIPIKISESQRPVFLEGEVELILQNHVSIYNGYALLILLIVILLSSYKMNEIMQKNCDRFIYFI